MARNPAASHKTKVQYSPIARLFKTNISMTATLDHL